MKAGLGGERFKKDLLADGLKVVVAEGFC